jgi:HSP20 family protein
MARLMPESWRDAFAHLREDVQRALDRWQRKLTRHRDYDDTRLARQETRLPRAMDGGGEDAWLPSLLFEEGPLVDVVDRDDEIVVVAEMPGLDPKDFSIEVVDSRLILRGEKRKERETRDRDYYYAERSFGSFRRIIELPYEVDAKRADAKYKDGMLQVTLPKAAHVRARGIKVAVK